MLRVTPIYGSRWDESGAAGVGNCTLVEYGNVRVLVNVGGLPRCMNEAASAGTGATSNSNDVSNTNNNSGISSSSTGFPSEFDLPPHDCLVLTDSTLESLGHLPTYLRTVTKQRQREQEQQSQRSSKSDSTKQAVSLPPIFATFPTVKMGQMTLYDYHANLCLDGAKPPYTLDEIDLAFSSLSTIKYSQTMSLPFILNDTTSNIGTRQATSSSNVKPTLRVTAYRAGHVVGGAFFTLQRIQDETTVVVTSTYHIAKEMHLDSSSLLQYGSTPDVLITRPGGPPVPLVSPLIHKKKMKVPLVLQSERLLVEQVLSVLRREGNALLPVDASGRVLELLLLLNQVWEKERLQNTYTLVWLGPMVTNTLEFCRSQLEWMAPALGHQFDQQGRGGSNHPFALKNVQLCTSMDQLSSITNSSSNPLCVMASGLDLDHGPARDLLLQWADNDNHAVIFTDSSLCTSRLNSLNDAWNHTEQVSPNAANDDDVVMEDATAAATNMNSDTNNVPNDAGKAKAAPVTPTAAAARNFNDAQEGIGKNAAVELIEDEETEAVAAGLERVSQANTNSTSWQLLSHWCAATLDGREVEDCLKVDVLVPSRAPLAGPALKIFLEQEEAATRKRKAEQEKRALLHEVELAKGRLRLGEDSRDNSKADSRSGPPPRGALSVKKPDAASSKSWQKKKKSRFDSSLFLKFSKPLHLTFEVREEAVGIGQDDATSKFGIVGGVGETVLEDDYGIAVQPDHFVDIVTGVDPSKFAGGSGRIGEGRAGFGFAAAGATKGGSGADGGSGAGKSKKRSAADGADGLDGDGLELMDERGHEATDLSEGMGIIRGRNGRPPVKVTTFARKLSVFCEISYIPLEGRVDSRSARQSVRALQPREVVVLGGPRLKKVAAADGETGKDDVDTVTVGMTNIDLVDEVTKLADAAKTFATGSKIIHTPSDVETVELDVGHAAYEARLVDTPFRTRQEKEEDPEPLEPVELYEAKLGACSVSHLDYVATGQKVAADGSIVLAPSQRTGKADTSALYLSDGDVLLTDLRSELIAQGMKADYTTDVGYSQLIVNGKVLLTKASDSGQINVEGPLCEDFFTVRSVVCSQYVVL